MEKLDRLFWVCKYCHIHKKPQIVIDITRATSSAAAHLSQPLKGHNLCWTSTIKMRQKPGQVSLQETIYGGVAVLQAAANAMGNFDAQQF
ncbi:hypothetical protein EJ02DRAFT_476776 [Clathrospora elynae]|uniref:Uncharacterized protein n=1 Tax=Clathrospora elynae TaxID=706981 RepID=A0A6A5SCQ2_9PLEO|nr:hypothetical protein EJ02DRAFT_476776 [Clathrospora elynae]